MIRFDAFGWRLRISLCRRVDRSGLSQVGDHVRSKDGFLVRDDQPPQMTGARIGAAQLLASTFLSVPDRPAS